MKQLVTLVILMVLLIGIDLFTKPSEKEIKAETSKQNHWFLLHRKTNREYFYFGIKLIRNNIPKRKQKRIPTKINIFFCRFTSVVPIRH